MKSAVAISAEWFQIVRTVCPTTRPVLPMMDLQEITATTTHASPSVPLKNSMAVESVDRLHQPRECQALMSMLCFGNQLLSFKGSEAERVAGIRETADFVAG
jgi:hypothetical protein